MPTVMKKKMKMKKKDANNERDEVIRKYSI